MAPVTMLEKPDETRAVKVDADLARQLATVALVRNVSVRKLLSQMLRKQTTLAEDYRSAVKALQDNAPTDNDTPPPGSGRRKKKQEEDANG